MARRHLRLSDLTLSLRQQRDTVSRKRRSEIMSSVGRANTAPEKALRALLRSRGYRFGANRSDLPGSPDIVLPTFTTVIFVHGCFWHRHGRCRRNTIPTSNKADWKAKFDRNIRRDRRVLRQLRGQGWHALTVWECSLRKRPDAVLSRITGFLRTAGAVGGSARARVKSISRPQLGRKAGL